MPKSFHAKVTAIEESKDLDDIKVQELIGSLQTYKLSLPSQRKSKLFALKTINERVEAHDSSDADVVDKDVAYPMKNFRKFLKFKKNGKFLKFKKNGKFVKKENSQVSERRKKISRGKTGRTLNPFKESRASNATDMDISRKSVLII